MSEAMATDEVPDVHKPASSADLVDEFEAAFQKCLTVLEKPETVERMTSEELRSAVDNNIMRFIELGRNLETFFLKKRFLISQCQPEQIMKEDIAELKVEIQRKEMLLQRHVEKVASWQQLLSSPTPLQAPGVSPGAAGAGAAPGTGGGAGPAPGQGVPHAMMTPGTGPGQGMRMMSPGAPRMPGAVPMMQPPIPAAGHLANLERSATNAGMP